MIPKWCRAPVPSCQKAPILSSKNILRGHGMRYLSLINRAEGPQELHFPDQVLNADVQPVVALNLPSQGEAVVADVLDKDYIEKQLQEILQPPADTDYLAVCPALCVRIYSLVCLDLIFSFSPYRNF